MSDFPPGSSAAANAKSPAYADALLRARQVKTAFFSFEIDVEDVYNAPAYFLIKMKIYLFALTCF
jgi:hypothetical protein